MNTKSDSCRMTPVEFMKKVVYEYRLARNVRYPHPNVLRGRSHSVSGSVEDLLAAFLAVNLSKDYQLYVDQPITLVNSGKSAYPDIALVSPDGQMDHVIDVKMDLGWNRGGMTKFCEGRLEFLKNFRKMPIRLREGPTKKLLELRVSPKCNFHLVIVSGENISEKKLAEALSVVKEFEPDVTTYILSDRIHPNEYEHSEQEVLELLAIKQDSFDYLVANLNVS